MDFYSLEAQDAIRFSWNNLPASKIVATRAVLPTGCLYSPMRDMENRAVMEYDPLRCKCGGILNPFVTTDFRTKSWTCSFCLARNVFPQHYAENMAPERLPPEMMQEYSTIEYSNPNMPVTPNIFIFVIDLCQTVEEMAALKDSIQQSMQLIPPNSIVGLVTFNRFVFVHELGFKDCSKAYAFKGSKDYTPQQIHEMLGIATKNDPRGPQGSAAAKRFLLPLSDCESTLSTILEDLQPDPWPVLSDERPQRCTGNALNVALSLLEACSNTGARLLLFVSGACTIGPGTVVGHKLTDTIRSYFDLPKDNENCQHVKKAQKYYSGLTQRAIKANTAVDIFGFVLDQFGLYEMRPLAEKTGGYILLNESFSSKVFKSSFEKLFDKDENGDLRMGFGARLNFIASKEVLVSGAIGPCTTLKVGTQLAETQFGEAETTSWYMGAIDRCSTIAIFIEVAGTGKETQGKAAYMQFLTQFRHSSGRTRLRVTTVARRYADPNNIFDLVPGFDQECAAVLMARLGTYKAETEDPLDVLRWVDRSLIRATSRFAEYKKDDVMSFRLGKEFQLYPQFMYHLRRSHFMQTFGVSPDEGAYYRSNLNRENCTNSLVMIQPALLEYNMQNPQPTPVQIDVDAMKKDVILLLDTYFHVVIWQGEHIHQWIKEKYHEQPEYEGLRNLIAAPLEDAKLIMEDRFPVPSLVETHYNHGKERLLKSKLIPSSRNPEQSDAMNDGQFISDDASLKVFMDYLIKLAVQSTN